MLFILHSYNIMTSKTGQYCIKQIGVLETEGTWFISLMVVIGCKLVAFWVWREPEVLQQKQNGLQNNSDKSHGILKRSDDQASLIPRPLPKKYGNLGLKSDIGRMNFDASSSISRAIHKSQANSSGEDSDSCLSRAYTEFVTNQQMNKPQ